MKNLLMILCSLVLSAPVFGQPQLTSASDSDPEAKAILEKMQKKYDGYANLEVSFTLDIELPGEPNVSQNIKVLKAGEKYRVEMPGQTVISDGTTLWLILENNKEVQINNVLKEDEDESILSPQSLFSIYEREDFAFVLANQMSENGKVVQQIEFKPLAHSAEYSKLRMTLVKGSADFVRMKAFGKDGSRFTLHMTNIVTSKTIPSAQFTFNKDDYKDYFIEDLRF